MLVIVKNGYREFFYNQSELEIKEYYDGPQTRIYVQDIDTGVELKLPIYVIKQFKGEEDEVKN